MLLLKDCSLFLGVIKIILPLREIYRTAVTGFARPLSTDFNLFPQVVRSVQKAGLGRAGITHRHISSDMFLYN